jgi:hypothetical protein
MPLLELLTTANQEMKMVLHIYIYIYIYSNMHDTSECAPCGGGLEYFHRSPCES